MKKRVAALTFVVAMFTGTAQAGAVGQGGWEALGGGLADTVSAVNGDLPGQILVGGRDMNAGGAANGDLLAGWNGTNWIPYPGLTNNPTPSTAVRAIAVDDGKIYAGGSFTVAGGAPSNGLAVWDAASPTPSWQPFCITSTAGAIVVDALEVLGDKLYVGGAFDTANADPAAENLVACDLTTGAMTPTVDDDGDIGGRVQALAADSAGNLYVGGNFINVNSDDNPGNANADYVAKYIPASGFVGIPDAMGNAAIDSANVDSLTTNGTDVYVGTDDEDIAQLPDADHVAKYNGSTWSALGTSFFPLGSAINGLATQGSSVYATGSFNDAGGDDRADGVAQFAGVWQPMGSEGYPPGSDDDGPLGGNGSGDGNAITVFNGSVIVGGAFVDAGGDVLADRIACFGPCPSPVVPPTQTSTRTFGSNLAASASKSEVALASGLTISQAILPTENTAAGGMTSPIKGVVVRWRIKVGNSSGAAVAPRIFRPGNVSTRIGAGTGTARIPPPNTTSTYDTRLPVLAGDGIGIDFFSGPMRMFALTATADALYWNPPLADGQLFAGQSIGGPRELLVNADVEPDADSDGFGDVTQDACPTDPATQGPCIPAPATASPPATKKKKCKKGRKLKKGKCVKKKRKK